MIDLKDASEAITALFTVVLGVSTIGLWRATQKLWEAGERQIEVAHQAAVAAQASAEAAQASVKQAHDTAREQLRPHLTLNKYRAENFRLEVGNAPSATFLLRNRGTTIANDVRLRIMTVWANADGAETRALQAKEDTPFSLVPGEKTEITQEFPALDVSMQRAAQEGRRVALLVIEVNYRDTYGERHRTRGRAYAGAPHAAQLDPDDSKAIIALEWFGEDNDAT
jgi:hypothetical protein